MLLSIIAWIWRLIDVAQPSSQSHRNPTISRAKANSGQSCGKVNTHCSPYKYDFESTLIYALVLLAHVIPLSIYHPLTPSKMFQPSAIISHVPVTEYHVNLPPCYSLVRWHLSINHEHAFLRCCCVHPSCVWLCGQVKPSLSQLECESSKDVMISHKSKTLLIPNLDLAKA